jgi:hypothetical protein
VLLKKKQREPRPEPAPPKKVEKKAEPARKPSGEKDEPVPEEGPEEKAEEILGRLTKNLRMAEDRLDHKDTSDATQQLQRDILSDLDALISQSGRRQPQPQEQQQQDSQQGSRPQRSGSKRQQGQPRAGGQRSQRSQTTARKSAPTPGQAAQRQAGAPRPADRRAEELNKIADLYKDVWGHLPETMRQEMDQYAREQFMAKYQDLLKQYYSTIAEKGRKKGE